MAATATAQAGAFRVRRRSARRCSQVTRPTSARRLADSCHVSRAREIPGSEPPSETYLRRLGPVAEAVAPVRVVTEVMAATLLARAGAGIEGRRLADPGGFPDGGPGYLLGRRQETGRPGRVVRR